MSTEVDYDETLDRTFFYLSDMAANFFSWTYGTVGYRLIAPLDPNKFDNATTKTAEIAIRAFIVLGVIVSLMGAGTPIIAVGLILGAGSVIFREAAFYFQKDGFTHVRGSAPEIVLEKGQATVMTWNIRGQGGGLHFIEAGVVHWSSRVDRIAETIKKENPDCIILQEVFETGLIEALIDRLGDRYAHFYTHLGRGADNQESGLMVITKCSVQNFSFTPFPTEEDLPSGGFTKFDLKASPEDRLPSVRIIGTQINAEEKQVNQIVDLLAKEKQSLPTIIGANLRGPQVGGYLSKFVSHSHRTKEPTHSNELANQWGQNKEDLDTDCISLFKIKRPDGTTLPVKEKNVRFEASMLGEAFDHNFDTQTALSDHQPIITKFVLPPPQ